MNNTTDQNNLKTMLFAFADALNEQRANMPIGCVSMAADGTYNANSIMDVVGIANNVNAPDGFVRDGLMVRFRKQIRSEKDDKFRGYRVIFELNGIYNGSYTVFTRTEFEYKMYLNISRWKVETHTVEYRPIVSEDTEVEAKTRKYSVPMVLDTTTDEFKCVDRSSSLNNKVYLALSNKLGDTYEAYLDGAKFDMEDKEFIK